MKRLSVIIAALLCAACSLNKQTSEPVDYVSTLVGTLSKFQLSTGNTYPAVALPWGTHFWTPLLIVASVGRYPADKLIRRIPIRNR